MSEIEPEQLMTDTDAIVVDVREPCEFATGSVPGARSIPAGQIRQRLYELPRGARIHLICANGARSTDLVPFMRAVGYDAYSVAGGMWAWSTRGSSAQAVPAPTAPRAEES